MHYEKFPDGTVKCIQDEIPFELPQGWEWCRLRNISSIISKGTTPKAGKNAYIDGDIGFVRIENLTDNYSISHEDMKYISNTTHINELKRSILQEHDLLITIAGTLGKTAVVRKENLPLNTNQAIAFIRFIDFEAINILFYCLIISSNTIKNRLLLQTKVTSIPNLTLEIISSCLIPLPPSHEQHRIVAKINELFVFVNTIESDKTDLQTTIQLAKSKILDLAIRGKLVPQNPDDEPASVLLERIRAEKEELIKQGKIKRDKKESVIFRGDDNSYYEVIGSKTTSIDDEIPFDLPKKWEWVRLGVLFSHNTGKALNKNDTTGIKMTYITTSNLYWDRFELDSLKEMNFNESEIEKCTVQKGDLLVCEGGDVGRAAIWNYDNEIRIQNHIHKLRPYSEVSVLLYYYVFYYYKLTDRINGKGIGIQGLSSNQLHNIFLPLPPLNEQKRIADKVSQLFSLLDSIADNVN